MKWLRGHTNSSPDEMLIARIKEGNDRQALGILFDRYVEWVYGVCLKYFKNTTLAKDAVMDVFEKVDEKLKRHDIDQFKPWLYQVTKNHCLEKLRTQSGKNSKIKAAEIVYSKEIQHPDLRKYTDWHLDGLKECMEGLPEKQRLCVQLFYLASKSYVEIGQSLGLTWAEVRSNIQNGRRNLRNCLKKNETSRYKGRGILE